jgi:hypothetical protein
LRLGYVRLKCSLLLTLNSNFSRSHLLLSPRHKKNKHQTVFGLADAETVERRKKEKEKFYERTEVVMGKCLLHKETDASKVDPEVRAFVGKKWV